jgi:hypothetical protein
MFERASDGSRGTVYDCTMFINRSLGDKIKFVEASIEGFGGKVKPSSRIWEAKRALFNRDGTLRESFHRMTQTSRLQ